MSLNCVLIGAGNLATHLGVEMRRKKINVVQVYSRTENSAKTLAKKLKSEFTINPNAVSKVADIYFIALKDSVVPKVLSEIQFSNKLVIHCSGSLPLSILENYSDNIGVLYPLQTFSKRREIDFSQIPVFIESNSKKNLATINLIASKLSSTIKEVNSEQRKALHVAAVFACNFVNHLYKLSESIVGNYGLEFDLLKPLIRETAQKVMTLSPEEAQTGPAVRFDETIISTHLETLSGNPELSELYKTISKSIFNQYKKTN